MAQMLTVSAQFVKLSFVYPFGYSMQAQPGGSIRVVDGGVMTITITAIMCYCRPLCIL